MTTFSYTRQQLDKMARIDREKLSDMMNIIYRSVSTGTNQVDGGQNNSSF